MRRWIAVVTGLLMTMAGVVAAVRPASAQPPGMDVSCGAIVTTNVTLGRDLIDCPNNGIVIGADNITIDLNGHTVDGDETLVEPCPAGEECDIGIVNVGHVGVTVTTGSISDFAAGVFLKGGADRNQLRHLSVTRSMFPGVLIIDSAHVTVEKNRISGNGVTTGEAGMRLFGVTRALIRGNRVSANGGEGLSALDSSDHNRIEGNMFSGNPEAGLGLEGAGNEVVSNRFLGEPVILIGDDNILRKNYVADPPVCDDGCGIAVSFEGGARNVIEENVVVRAPIRGIRIDAYVAAAVNNIVRGNIVRDAGVDGIGINLDHVGDVTGSLVERNIVTGSGDDGIDVESPSTTLRGNLAVHNGDLGIEAVSGVTDGGGNRAFANGNPLQCTNIQCSAARAAH